MRAHGTVDQVSERAELVEPIRLRIPRDAPSIGAILCGIVILGGLGAGGYGWYRFIETDRSLALTSLELEDTTETLGAERAHSASLAGDLSETRDTLDDERARGAALARSLEESNGRVRDREREISGLVTTLGGTRAALAAERHGLAVRVRVASSLPPPDVEAEPVVLPFVAADGTPMGEARWHAGLGTGHAAPQGLAPPGVRVYEFWVGDAERWTRAGVVTETDAEVELIPEDASIIATHIALTLGEPGAFDQAGVVALAEIPAPHVEEPPEPDPEPGSP